LDQAERERTWALASARTEGISIRTLATAAGLSPSRVHQLVADADLDAVIAALGELRAAGWPAPEDPDSDEDTDLDGRDHLADRLPDEVDWLRQCAGWLRQLDGAATRRRSTCACPATGRTAPSWPSTWRGCGRSSTASPPTWTNSPAPGGPGTCTPRRYSPTGGRNAAGGWPSRTWSSGPSAPQGLPASSTLQAEVARGIYDETGADGRRKYTVAEIAETFGVSRKTVYRHLEPSAGRRQPGKSARPAAPAGPLATLPDPATTAPASQPPDRG